MIYRQKSELCLPFFGITDSSGLIPLSRYRDNGIINNGESPSRELEKRSVLERLRVSDRGREVFPKHEEQVLEGRTR